jgi:hypothetical protein
VVLKKMLLHTANKTAIRAHCTPALGTFKMEMVAVTARVAVGGARSRFIYEFVYASVRREAVKTAVYGGLRHRVPLVSQSLDYLVGTQTAVICFEKSEDQLSLFGFVSVFQNSVSPCKRRVKKVAQRCLKMKLGFKFEVYFIISR